MKQPGGCNPSPCSAGYPWRCSWPAHMLKDMLMYQRERKRGGGYNEVIVDAEDKMWKLPEMVEAIFETHAGHGVAAHASFL
eukprot:6217456-Prymnesium_polylepis.2